MRIAISTVLLLVLSIPAAAQGLNDQPYRYRTLASPVALGPVSEDGQYYFAAAGSGYHVIRRSDNKIHRSLRAGDAWRKPSPGYFYDQTLGALVVYHEGDYYVWDWQTGSVSPYTGKTAPPAAKSDLREPKGLAVLAQSGSLELLADYNLVPVTLVNTAPGGSSLTLDAGLTDGRTLEAAFSPDGQQIAVTYITSNPSKGHLYIWDTASGNLVDSVSDTEMGVRISEWGILGLVLWNDADVIVLNPQDLSDRRTLNVGPQVQFVQVVNEGAYIICELDDVFGVGAFRSYFKILDAATGVVTNTLQGHKSVEDFFLAGPDSDIVMLDWSGVLQRVNLDYSVDWSTSSTLFDLSSFLTELRLSHSDETNLFAYTHGGVLQVLDTLTGQARWDRDNSFEAPLSFSGDGAYIMQPIAGRQVWDSVTAEQQTFPGSFAFERFTTRAAKEMVRVDGASVSIGDFDSTLTPLATLSFPEALPVDWRAYPLEVVPSRGGDYFAAGYVNAAFVGNTATGEITWLLPGHIWQYVEHLALTADGNYAILNGDGVEVWHVPTQTRVKRFDVASNRILLDAAEDWLYMGNSDITQWPFSLDAAGVACAGSTTDSDADGLSDCLEQAFGTDPHEQDSDGDWVPDGLERELGTDPRITEDTPVTTNEDTRHAADYAAPFGVISLSELVRTIQLFNIGGGGEGAAGYGCAADGSEDGYAPGSADTSCTPHSLDYAPQDWRIGLSEMLRMIQIYNAPGSAYYPCPGNTDDGFCHQGQD